MAVHEPTELTSNEQPERVPETIQIIQSSGNANGTEPLSEPANNNKPQPQSGLTLNILKIVSIAIFAYSGALARVLLAQLNVYLPFHGTLGSGYYLPNIVGCFVMGFLSKLTHEFRHRPAIFVGLGTGFCGCCTTFATWMAKVAKLFLEKKVDKAFAHIFVVFCTSFCSFELGTHAVVVFKNWLAARESKRQQSPSSRENELVSNNFANAVRRMSKRSHSEGSLQPSVASKSEKDFIERVSSPKVELLLVVAVFLAITATLWILAGLDPSKTRVFWWIATSFAPIGALLRYFLSLHNPRLPHFPLFTFIGNITASCVNIVLYVTGELYYPNSFDFKFWALSGVSTGCMGSLSTVSTWVNEINKLMDANNPVFAYRYGLASVLTAQVACLIIGGVWFALG